MAKRRVPKFRLHKATGQGFVEVEGHRHYLGKFDLPETEQRYHRFIAEWLANGCTLPVDPETVTITEVCARYIDHVDATYQRPQNYRPALRILRRCYGDLPAAKFGPRSLKAVREQMVEEGWSRKYVNKNVHRLRRMFAWAASEEIIPAQVCTGLQTVEGLRRGRTTAPERSRVTPVPPEHVDAIKPYVPRQIWAMVELQLLTGARPGELVTMRPTDIEMGEGVWIYRPANHKTAHVGREREIYLGPRSQQVIHPFLAARRLDAYLFSPREAKQERCQQRPTHRPEGAAPTPRKTSRRLGERYTTGSYAQAIARGIKLAFRPEGLGDEKFREWKCPQHWSPHQLRHSYATEVRREHGLEAAQVLLGHAKADVTQTYAERDRSAALAIAKRRA